MNYSIFQLFRPSFLAIFLALLLAPYEAAESNQCQVPNAEGRPKIGLALGAGNAGIEVGDPLKDNIRFDGGEWTLGAKFDHLDNR